MYQKLADVQLKTGETVELGALLGPDASPLATKVKTLLSHKGRIWQWQIAQSLDRDQPETESRFYLLLRQGEPFANIMLVESRRIGIFGHVYTRPEERRKGAAEHLAGRLVADFARRGGRAMYLGTGYDSAAYHIYARHGFRGIEPESGYMAWFAPGLERTAFEAEAFAPSWTRHEALEYRHWPTLPALAMMYHPARLRIAGMDVIGPAITEGGALPVLMAMHGEADHTHDNGGRAHVAVSGQSGVPVAIACATPEPHFWKQVDVVDLFCAPGFEEELPALVQALQLLPGRRAICYADLDWPAKQEILAACGFQRAALLERHYRSQGAAQALELWAKG
jgi:GNAT superfamily N-acetyltransferase